MTPPGRVELLTSKPLSTGSLLGDFVNWNSGALPEHWRASNLSLAAKLAKAATAGPRTSAGQILNSCARPSLAPPAWASPGLASGLQVNSLPA